GRAREFAIRGGCDKWAQEALPAKNRLTVPDARLLEDAFEKRLSEFLSLSSAGGEAPSRDGSEIASTEDLQTAPSDIASSGSKRIHQAASQGIDKSVLAL